MRLFSRLSADLPQYITIRSVFLRIPIRGVLSALGGFIVCLSFAVQYSYSNLNTYMTSYMRTTEYNPGLTYADFVFITTTNGIVQGALMPVLGMLARKLGVRCSLLLGSFIYSAGFAVTYWTLQSYFGLVVLTMAMNGVGFGFIYSTAIGNAARWFRAKSRGFISSLVISGYGFGALIWIPVQTNYVNPNNIKATLDPDCLLTNKVLCDKYYTDPEILDRVPSLFLMLGGIYMAFGIVAALLVSEPPPDYDPEIMLNLSRDDDNIEEMAPSSTGADATTGDHPENNSDALKGTVERAEHVNYTPKEVIKTKNFYLIWICFLGIMLTQGIITNFSKTFGLTFINDDHYFAKMAIVSNIINGLFRIVWGLLYDRWKFRGCYFVMSSIVISFVATFPALSGLEADSQEAKAAYGIWLCTLYMAIPCIFVIVAASVNDLYGKEHFQANFGLLFTQNVCYTIIIIVVTKVRAVFSVLGYTGLFEVGAAVAFLGLIACFFLPSQGSSCCTISLPSSCSKQNKVQATDP